MALSKPANLRLKIASANGRVTCPGCSDGTGLLCVESSLEGSKHQTLFVSVDLHDPSASLKVCLVVQLGKGKIATIVEEKELYAGWNRVMDVNAIKEKLKSGSNSRWKKLQVIDAATSDVLAERRWVTRQSTIRGKKVCVKCTAHTANE